MKNTDILSRINALLSKKVELEQQTLENGIVVEADAFEVGNDIFAIDGENKTPLEVGDYVLADGSTLSVTEIGVIGEIATAQAEVAEEEVAMEEVEMAEVPPTLEEIVLACVGAMQPKLDELNAKIDALTGAQTEMKATLSSIPANKSLTHKPTEEKVSLSKMKINLSNTEALIMSKIANKKNQ